MKKLPWLIALVVMIAPGSPATSQQTSLTTNTSTPQALQVCVLGDVVRPAMIPFHSGLTVTQAIAQAGGIPKHSKSDEVLVHSRTMQGVNRIIDVDLAAVRKKPYKDLVLQAFEVVQVVFKNKPKPEQLTNPCPIR